MTHQARDTPRNPRRRHIPALGAFVALVLTFGLAACGGDDSTTSADAKNIYLNAYAQEIQYFRDWQDGATANADGLGWSVESEFGNVTPEQQVQQIENALVKQPDAILVTPLDQESLSPVLQQATDQGVAVITVGANVADPNAYVSFVARDNVELGREKAQYVVDQLGGEGTVGIVRGIRGLSFSEESAEGYAEVLDAEPGIEVVDAGFAGGFSGDLGLQQTENLLTRNADVDAIIYDNDDLALGGVEALKSRNIQPDDVLIVGTDGGDVALDAVAKGDIDMTISLCGYREGIQAIDTLNTYFEEGSVSDRVISETEMFTTENVKAKQAELTPEDCA